MRRLAVFLVVVVVLVGGVVAFDRFAPERAAAIELSLERARAGLEPKQTTIPGFEIAYLEGGQGPALVLVHGFGADKDNFTRVARYLTPHFHVVIPDLPGFGESSRPEGASYGITEQAERMRALAAGLGLEKPHVGGSSMGGAIVAAWAAAHTTEVSSLWLLAPGRVDSAPPSEMDRVRERTGRMPLIAERPEDFADIMALVVEEPPFLPYGVRHHLATRAAADAALHARIFDEIHEGPATEERLAGLYMPTLIVWGEKDRVLSPEGGPILESVMPSAELDRMADIGHLPMVEAPHLTAEHYLRFLAGSGALAPLIVVIDLIELIERPAPPAPPAPPARGDTARGARTARSRPSP